MRRRFSCLLWPAVSFVLSLLLSSTGGRALWCDEILRINGQHYTIEQLFAFKHLHDFCTQTPTGYLFMRPFQLLLGYEFGGNLVAALSAATITASVIFLLRRYSDDGRVNPLACAIAALNPLLLYYGSELSFYGMFAAAFAVAFAFAMTLDDEVDFRGQTIRVVGLAVSGALFITFHFAGMFVWSGFAAAVVIDCLCRKGFKSAFNRALLLFIPMAVNIPMYLGAEGKAVHLGTQQVAWSKLPGLPWHLWHYLYSLFPSFTGGWIVGVALFAFGAYVLFCKADTRRVVVLSVASILSILFFLAYSGLHDYVPPVARYWVYALAPALFVTAFAVNRLFYSKCWLGIVVAATVIAADVVADSVLFFAGGRNCPYAEFVRAVPENVPGVVYVNHYETRFFGRYYPLPNGMTPSFPSYWEQGEQARLQGLKLINRLAPLCPVYIQDDAQERMAREAGWSEGNRVDATMPFTFQIAKALHLNPEPANATSPSHRMFVPQESELIAAAEKGNKPFFLPGDGWRLASIPPKKADQPFTPVLMLAAGQSAELKVYVPKSFAGDSVTLSGYLGRGKSAAERYSAKLNVTRKGDYVSAKIDGGKDGCYFLYPDVR